MAGMVVVFLDASTTPFVSVNPNCFLEICPEMQRDVYRCFEQGRLVIVAVVVRAGSRTLTGCWFRGRER